MQKSLWIIICALLLFAGCASCQKTDLINNEKSNKMKIKIGNSVFTATLEESEAATAFKSRLPITMSMVELNGNEKYADLPGSIPANSQQPSIIHSGDLMLYGSSTVVLFYKTFNTSYTYTRLGKIDDTSGLVAALGNGNVSVIFEL